MSLLVSFSTNPSGYKGVSVLDHIATIHAPVLMLQGTGDQSVIWQTVQDVADAMKRQRKDVKLILCPGGQHGLLDKYQQQSSKEIAQWFNTYGLPSPGFR